MSRLLRGTSILVIVASFFLLGESLRPTPAAADVFQRIAVQLSSLADFLDLEERTGGKRLIRWNGETLYSELSRSTQTPREILDELDARANLEYAQMDLEPTIEKLSVGAELTYAFRRPFRQEGEGWGVFGRLTAGPLTPITDITNPLSHGKGLGPSSEQGFVVLATREPGAYETDVWTIRFKDGLDPLALVGAPGEDVNGGDLPGIDRYPASTRILRMTESAASGVTHVVAYEGGGSVDGHVSYYRNLLRAAGMSLTNESRSRDDALLQFSGRSAQVDVFVGPADGSVGIVDLIQLRP